MDHISLAALAEQFTMPMHVHLEAFLPTISRANGIGDFVPCAARVVTAVLVRMLGMAHRQRRVPLATNIPQFAHHAMAGKQGIIPLVGATRADRSVKCWT